MTNTGDEDEGEGGKEAGRKEGLFVLGDKGLALDREETDVAQRQMPFITVQGETHARMRCLILTRQINQTSYTGAFNCWTYILGQPDLGGQPQEEELAK